MPAKNYTDEEIVEAYAEHGSYGSTAKALGVDRTNLARRIKRMAASGRLGTAPVIPGMRISKISNTPRGDYIQQRPELSEEPFQVPEGHTVRGHSVLTDPNGNVIQMWTKTVADKGTNDLVEALKHVFDSYTGKSELIAPPAVTDTDLLSVYPIADQHIGLLSWGRETGSDYDLDIGAERLRTSMRTLVSQSPSSEQAIILNLGDWQHTDDDRNMTPRGGNLLDVDSRYVKILVAGVELMKECIELSLQKHRTVRVRNIRGNHDPHASVALTVGLKGFYSNNPRVTIDEDPNDFFFYRFGSNLIGATHGHTIKPADMAWTLATDRPKDWGETEHRWFLYGHFHQTKVTEIKDVKVECFRTIAGNDAWSHTRGFRSGKTLTAVTLHRRDGEIGRHMVNISRSERAAA